MSEQNENLSPRQRRAVLALIERGSIEKAAEDCKVSPRTLRRWLRQEHFRSEYLRVGEELYEQAVAQLQRLSTLAAVKLAQALINGSIGQTLRAAEIVFTHGKSAVNLKLDAKLRLEGGCGVLAVSAPVDAETWKTQAEELVKYQEWLMSQGPAHGGNMTKPTTKENDGVS